VIETEFPIGNFQLETRFLFPANGLGDCPRRGCKYPDLPDKLEDLKNHHEESYNHLEDTAILAYAVGEYLKLPEEEKNLITLAAYLHDIGKLNIDTHILNKPSKLTDSEYEEIRKHVDEGFNIVSKYDRDIANIIHYHHKFKKILPYPKDIAIYPDNKIRRDIWEAKCYEEEIKRLGKILAIIDTFHALISNRVYNKNKINNRTITLEEYKNMLEKCKDITMKELNLTEEDKKIINCLVELKLSIFNSV
jgi:putative nucleotidyltransferase with HDIG domain